MIRRKQNAEVKVAVSICWIMADFSSLFTLLFTSKFFLSKYLFDNQ